MSTSLELRNSVTGKIFPAIGPFIIGGMFGFGALQGLASGADGGHVLVIAVMAVACLALGASIARGAFDTSVKVVLDENGFRDRRAGDVLVPWREVRSVRLTSGKGAAMLNFELIEEPPDAVAVVRRSCELASPIRDTAMLRLALAALLLATPAHAAEMAFFVKNLRSQAVAVELFSRNRETVWPGGDSVFLIQPGSQKSVPISCNSGENICYGAWVNGQDHINAGVGPDNDQPCDNCCFICVEKTTETIDLVP